MGDGEVMMISTSSIGGSVPRGTPNQTHSQVQIISVGTILFFLFILETCIRIPSPTAVIKSDLARPLACPDSNLDRGPVPHGGQFVGCSGSPEVK